MKHKGDNIILRMSILVKGMRILPLKATCGLLNKLQEGRNCYMKRIISLMLAAVLMMGLGGQVFAVTSGEQRVAVGADLTSEQRETVFDYFNLNEGDVDEITVTISNERKYLENVDASRIGSRSMSSIYIITKKDGEGLDIKLNNIDWLTEDIYRNALITAGITDAKVIIASPVAVSGTAALTGIYMAYEDIAGESLDEQTKQVATEELVTTGDLADAIGGDEAAALVNELKLIIDELKDMTDAQVRDEIKKVADNNNINVTDDQVEQLLKLVRSLENIDLGGLTDALQSVANALGGFSSSADSVSGFWGKVTSFFSGIGSFFSNLFN